MLTGGPALARWLSSTSRGKARYQLNDAVIAFLALALTDIGREREAVSVALAALAPHLHRYQVSVSNYARQLVEPGGSPG